MDFATLFSKTPHQLPDYGLLGISGARTVEFLQSVITNDMANITTETPALYAAHLTPQGKIVADFLVTFLEFPLRAALCLPRSALIPLAQALHNYAVGMQIEFEDLTDTYAISLGKHPDAVHSFTDPRPLPFRPVWSIIPLASASILPNGDQQWQSFRVEHCLPSAPQDLFGKPLPAEWGFEHLHGVSFSKGCYVGQEVTARMHHRTEPKKRLYSVRLNANSPLKSGDEILSVNGTEAGWLLSISSASGMALLRDRIIEKSPALQHVSAYQLAPWWPR